MNFVETLLVITSGLCITLIGILLIAHKDAGRLENKNEALQTEIADLKQKLKDQTQKDNVTLQALRQCYDNEVERQKKQIEGFHAGTTEELKKLLEIYRASNASGTLVMELDDDPKK